MPRHGRASSSVWKMRSERNPSVGLGVRLRVGQRRQFRHVHVLGQQRYQAVIEGRGIPFGAECVAFLDGERRPAVLGYETHQGEVICLVVGLAERQ
jgi:hypothetical protein